MQKPGLIGGIGPESTLHYYKRMIESYRGKTGNSDYPEILINSINMTKMLNFVFRNELEALVNYLSEELSILEHAGADFAILASNTPHIVFDMLQEKSKLKLISIVEETCKAIHQNNLTRVALFGTKSTMSNGFYQQVAKKYGIQLIIPAIHEMEYIHDKYMSELVHNRIYPDTKQQLLKIANRLYEENKIQGLILGGTELPLIISQDDFPEIKIFDSTEIHVQSIVNYMVMPAA